MLTIGSLSGLAHTFAKFCALVGSVLIAVSIDVPNQCFPVLKENALIVVAGLNNSCLLCEGSLSDDEYGSMLVSATAFGLLLLSQSQLCMRSAKMQLHRMVKGVVVCTYRFITHHPLEEIVNALRARSCVRNAFSDTSANRPKDPIQKALVLFVNRGIRRQVGTICGDALQHR
jgi:hypothetical protein